MDERSAVDRYFAAFCARLSDLARERGADIDVHNLDPRVASEVLKLAAAVAHTSERKFAPLASFLAGVAVGSLRSAGRLSADEETVKFIVSLRRQLDEPRGKDIHD